MKNSQLVSIGLRAKTGRAIAVVLGGSADAPIVLAKTEIKLTDPKIPATSQPYHEVMDLPWEESQRRAQKFVRAIEKVATKVLAQLIKQQTSNCMKVRAIATVGSKDRDLTRIGNNHIRAHAAEGILFRRVLEAAAQVNGLPFRTFHERDFEQSVKDELGPRSNSVRKKLDEAARVLSPPWRADEKLAAMAAWLVLHSSLQNLER